MSSIILLMLSQHHNGFILNQSGTYRRKKTMIRRTPRRLTENINAAARNVLKLYGDKSISTIDAANKIARKPLAGIENLNQTTKL
ncbi:MAG: hypothetical protein M3N14_07180 [Bacteroidota bacterium]|nr:hypothetical protein [Bacteroidota bacterium]